MKESIYLYGFIASGAPPPASVVGIEERPAELLDLEGFVAVISRVPADAFSPDALARGLADLDWVAERGVQHERVVTWFVDQAWILPARLLTVYSSEEALLTEAARHRARIEAAFRELGGRREWDLKISYDPERTREGVSRASSAIASLEAEIAEASPGRRYLLERRRDALIGEEETRMATAMAQETLDRAGAEAERVRLLDTPEEAVESRILLNAALLVGADREDRVRREVGAASEELRSRGLDVTFSGPWAPYRFVEPWEVEGEARDTGPRSG